MPNAIKVENLSKVYQLGLIGTGTIASDLERWFARIRGKEDPFLKIGETNDRTTKGESDVVWSLKDINFEVEAGDAVGIIGYNGAGKSTLLKILSQITSPTTGSVKMNGRVASLLEVGTGFHPELTGRENIYLNGAIMGMRKKEIQQKFDEIVDFSGVERYIDTPVKRYSSGMYVRLAFAVAAHLESEILIVDEVLAVGDFNFKKKCMEKMKDMNQDGSKTVLFVSHDMTSIRNLCNKAFILDKGYIVKTGEVKEVVETYLRSDLGNELSTLTLDLTGMKIKHEEILKFTSFSIIDSETKMPAEFNISKSRTYEVVVKFDLLIPDARLVLAVCFYSGDETMLFATDMNDDGDFNFGNLSMGSKTFSFKVPGNLLAPGEYFIELVCALHNTYWILEPKNKARIKFNFVNDAPTNSYSTDSRLGYLAPVISWNKESV
jgi:lipopolysaccharide transport system ATP-binding protein